MSLYTDFERDLATHYKLTPQSIRALIQAYYNIARYSVIRTPRELDEAIMEVKTSEGYIYNNIPFRIRSIIKKYHSKIDSLGRYGNLSSFYSPHLFNKNIHKFIAFCIKERVQPREFYEDGIVTYKSKMRNILKDNTFNVIDYKEKQ